VAEARCRTSKKELIMAKGFLFFLMLLLNVNGLAQNFTVCEDERYLTRRKIAEIIKKWPLRRSDPVTDFVRDLGASLTKQVHVSHKVRWYFNVIKDYSPNAYAMGNGYIYITEGAIRLCNNKGELAAVLAHEIGHQVANHFCGQDQKKQSAGVYGRIKHLDLSQPKPRVKQKIGNITQIINIEKEA
jgi:predicted Zn-dependent protease